ncbi:MAG: hypothetical protein ACR2H5_03650, partial [Ktedonobacteraceae bacterium]
PYQHALLQSLNRASTYSDPGILCRSCLTSVVLQSLNRASTYSDNFAVAACLRYSGRCNPSIGLPPILTAYV